MQPVRPLLRLTALLLALSTIVAPMDVLASASQPLSDEASRLWSQARALINQGLQASALQPLKRARQLAPESVQLHCDYQDLMTAQGFIVDLVKDYEGRRDADPSNPNLHYLFGRATGDPRVAETSFLRALELDSKNKWALQGLGGVAAVRGDLDAAQGRYEEALAVDPSFVIARNKLAGLSYARGDNEAAKRAWRAAIDASPDDYHAYLNMGAVLSIEGDLEGSAELLQLAVQRAPGNPLAFVNLGYVLFKLRRFELASANFAAALAINPRDRTVAGSLRLAEDVQAGSVPFEAFAPYEKALSAGSRDPAKAAQHYREVLLLAPNFAVAHSQLGLALLALGEADEGIKELRKAVSQSPDDAGLLFNLGTGLMATEDFGRALKHLERAQDIDSGDLDILTQLALTQLALGRAQEACNSLGKALEVQPRDPVLWVQLASARGARGDLEGAAKATRRALMIAPGFASARMQLLAILVEDKRFDEALAELTLIEQLAPGNEEVARQRLAIESARDAHLSTAERSGNMRFARIFVTSQRNADTVADRLRAGESFEELARTYGEGDERSRSGDIGYLDPSSLKDELARAVRKLKVGKWTGPVGLGSSWVFLKRTD